MTNEICKKMNPKCILITCCSSPCEDLKWRIESKLRQISYEALYQFYKGHIDNKKTCPICNREDIILRNNYELIEVKCTFCNRVFVYHMGHKNEWFLNSIGISPLIKNKGQYNKWNNAV